MSYGASPDDIAIFERILSKDSENLKCFECHALQPNWCDTHHGIFICLECSGTHRSFGVHISFVRSMTMDTWTSWNPTKIRIMEIGGNRRAREYFESKNLLKRSMKERYADPAALMYKDMLDCEAKGIVFDEATWVCPSTQKGDLELRTVGFGSQPTVCKAAPTMSSSVTASAEEFVQKSGALFEKGWTALGEKVSSIKSTIQDATTSKGNTTTTTTSSNDESRDVPITQSAAAGEGSSIDTARVAMHSALQSSSVLLKTGWEKFSAFSSTMTKNITNAIQGNEGNQSAKAYENVPESR